LFKKFEKSNQPSIEYIENKYKIRLTYPFQIIEKNENFNDNFYDELKSFGCSDILCGTSWLHRDCFSKKCKSCNFYPVTERNLKTERLDKIKKINNLNGKN